MNRFSLIYIDLKISILLAFVGLAVSPNNNEVHIYHREDGKWLLNSSLSQHDLRVTSIDWAKKTNRIVTCSAVC